MKKLLALILALCMVFALAACGGGSAPAATEAPAAEAPAEEAPAEEAPAEEAPAEKAPEDYTGEVVLYTSMTDSDLDALITSFNEVYPNVYVDVQNGSAGELTTRIRGEASNPQGDVTWGGMADSDGRTYEDIYEDYVTAHDAENVEAYRSPNGLYSMDHLSTVAFCVNTELEAELGLDIQSYADLLDPKLTGKVVTASPHDSSAAWNNVCNIMSVFGNDSDEAWDYIAKLMPQLTIVQSSSTCFRGVYDGEYVVGLTYEDGAITLVRDGATNVEVRYPAEGTSAAVYGMALIKNGPNPENAKLLIDFVTSAEGQTAMAAKQMGTLRYTNANYTEPDGAWLKPASEIKWVDRDTPYLTEHKADILEHWDEVYAEVVG